MDLYVERAISIGRLNYYQLEKVHEVELNGRQTILSVWDVTQGFRLQKVFAHWGVPQGSSLKDRMARDKHFQRVSAELKAAGCLKSIFRTTTAGAIEEWHPFDLAVQAAIEHGQLDLMFRRSRAKSKLLEEVEKETL